jgi:hypothetical protein
MKACPKCGTDNIDTAKFCKQCASPLQQAGGKTCPAGKHTMDPTWTECVYCKQESSTPTPGPVPPVRTPTVVEGSRGHKPTEIEGSPRPSQAVNQGGGPPQAVNAANRQRANTVFRSVNSPMPEGSDQAAPSVVQGRKVVGVLVTYSWSPEGQVFPVREGRNFIGRDKDCEICIPEDQTMSGRNSHITYRQNFVVGDMVSMTGTDLNGTPIEEQFHALGNYATLRAGSTYFTFIVIKPQSGEDSVAVTQSEKTTS